MTSAISSSVAGPAQALLDSVNGKAATAQSTAEATQDRFMKLLVVQMKNQDPLNPMDNAQVTSQMAQLSTVTGIDKMNATLQTLNTSFQSNQNVQATALIGHGVMVPGSTVNLQNGQALLGVDLQEPADKVTVTIRDKSGNAVNTMDLGQKDIGMLPLAWDGKTDKGATAPDGEYSFDVTATRGTDKAKVAPMAVSVVNSVSTNATGVKLNLQNQSSVDMSVVRQII